MSLTVMSGIVPPWSLDWRAAPSGRLEMKALGGVASHGVSPQKLRHPSSDRFGALDV
jgi:hypothetical protein